MSTASWRARYRRFSRSCPPRFRSSRPDFGRFRTSSPRIRNVYSAGLKERTIRESMSLAIEKSDVIEKHRTHETDTGSPESQAALMTERVRYLTDHLKQHPQDHHTRLGLLRLVGRRRRLLDYLARRDISRYRSLVEQLGLRR